MVGHAHGYLKPLESYGICSSTRFFVIAEIGLNHGGDIVLAKKIIDSAVRSGAQAVKFQTYTAEKRVDPSSALFPILKKCELSYQAFSELKA